MDSGRGRICDSPFLQSTAPIFCTYFQENKSQWSNWKKEKKKPASMKQPFSKNGQCILPGDLELTKCVIIAWCFKSNGKLSFAYSSTEMANYKQHNRSKTIKLKPVIFLSHKNH